MGFFHEGHLSLMRMAKRLADRVVVSLFVNPTQFGPDEDLATYPTNFPRDQELAAANGAAILFAPTAEAMYPPGSRTTVVVSGLTDNLCGASRPGHFTGVTTVVSKLFHLVRPDLAVFGQKDFQQLAVIRRMCLDLNMGIEIVGHPIVREADGLAMSSRNSYLAGTERESALCLSRALQLVRQLVADGERSASRLADAARRLIASSQEATVDYISFVDQTTLKEVSNVDRSTVLALAVKIGDKVRLIDNGYVIESTGNQH
jgi:pantoate--beta-alanine ligase